MKQSIKIGKLEITEQSQIMNEAPEGKKIIATVFGSKNEVKRDLKPYLNKGYDFYYTTLRTILNKKFHSVRVLTRG